MAKVRKPEVSVSAGRLDDDAEAARLWRTVCASGFGAEEWAPQSDRVVAARARRLVEWVEDGAEVPSTVEAALRPDWRETLSREGVA